MPHWIVAYGVFVSVCSMGAVLMMSRITKRQRREMNAMHSILMATMLSASNMWDQLTPEQIRRLHPNAVEVGNGLPKWEEVESALDELQLRVHTD